ncbi:hypothetical protein CJD50_20890 [Hafnia paralvei]|uniref:Uncharacterized protein n=2 Tax=Hafnia paralvei TaxID=546367 RepID=A0A2A2M7W9_9GAMM|nr:hypothetical protein CJD50_20890 [Hafnia paralvei]
MMNAKTHTGITVTSKGEKRVKLRQTPTTWIVSKTESYYRETGSRCGGFGRAKLLLASIKPIVVKEPDNE